MATTITDARAFLVDVAVETERTDAVQSFVKQETIFVELTTSDGLHGRGYSYTIGTGGRAVLSMLRDHLLDLLIGQEADRIEAIWHRLFASTRATTTGAITSLALAAVDTALWDVAAQRAGLPLWRLAGGFRRDVPLYDTEGGWLHLSTDDLVEGALASQRKGLSGVKVKIGKPTGHEDRERLAAVRDAVGAGLRPHGRRQPVDDRDRGHPPGPPLRRTRPRLDRGAAPGRRHRRPRRASRAPPRRRSPSASRCTPSRSSASTSTAARPASCRSTSPASAASRRG